MRRIHTTTLCLLCWASCALLLTSCGGARSDPATGVVVEPPTIVAPEEDEPPVPTDQPQPPELQPPEPEEREEPEEAPEPSPTELDATAVILSPRSAEIVWKTDRLATSEARVGTAPDLRDAVVSEGRLDRYHRVLVTGLEAGRTYYFRATSVSDAGTASSEVRSFSIPVIEPTRVRTDHPRIFFTAEQLPELRRRISTSHLRYWQAIDRYCQSVLPKDPAALASEVNVHLFVQAMAFAAAVSGSPEYIAKAEAVALACAALTPSTNNQNRRTLLAMSFVYDWLHRDLSRSARETLRTSIPERMGSIHVHDREFLWGWNPENFGSLTVGAVAVWGEASDADDRLEEYLYRFRHGIFPAWRHFGQTGGTMEGWWYSGYHIDIYLDAILALRTATNVDFLESEPWLDRLVDFFCLGLRADGSFHRVGDSRVAAGFAWENRRFASCMAGHFRNRRAQWLAMRIEEGLGVWGPTAVSDVLFYDPDLEPLPPSGRCGGFFPDAGFVLESSSWDADAVQILFRSAREFTLGHTHRDNNSFTVFYKGAQALDSGTYDDYAGPHHVNYYERSIAHNTIVVFDPAEEFRRHRLECSNDGGQRYLLAPEQVETVMPGTIEDTLEPAKGYQAGGILFHESTEDHVYTMADAGPSYGEHKVRAFDRHLVFLKRVSGLRTPVLLVFDRVVSTQAGFRKAYLLHTQNAPKVSGATVSATNRDGMIFHETLLPQRPDIRVIGGPGYEFWVDGQTHPPSRPPGPLEDAGRYRVEVAPGTPREEDRFLHAVFLADAGSELVGGATLLDASVMVGAYVGDWVVLFPLGRDIVEEVSYPLPAAAAEHLLAGLAPSEEYALSIDGVDLGRVQASGEGTLRFATGSGARVSLVRAAGR